MLTFSEFFLLHESFDTVSDFLLNPEHRDKEFYELEREFEENGGVVVGQGSKGKVFAHPKWPYVVKLFYDDFLYLKFVRYAYKINKSYFPKFYGPPQKITPFFTREEGLASAYISRIEKLIPITEEEFKLLNSYEYIVNLYLMYKTRPDVLINHLGSDPNNEYRVLRLKEIAEKFEHVPERYRKVLAGKYHFIRHIEENNWMGGEDWHMRNIMKRENGEFVLIDPIWEGYVFNAHRDHADYINQLTGADYPDYDEAPPIRLRGGELPKKKRIKKRKEVSIPYIKPEEVSSSEDIPF